MYEEGGGAGRCDVQETGPQAMAASVLTTLALAPPTYQLCILMMCKIYYLGTFRFLEAKVSDFSSRSFCCRFLIWDFSRFRDAISCQFIVPCEWKR